jgi:hypothetical protein
MTCRAPANVPLFVTRPDRFGYWVEEVDDGRLFQWVSLVDVGNTGLELVADRNRIYEMVSPMDQSVGKKRIDPRGSAKV